MVIRIKNCSFTENGKNGMLVDSGFNIDMEVEGSNFSNNGENGLHLKRDVSLIEQLGLPEDTNPRELAELLRALNEMHPARRQSAVESSGLVRRWAERGLNVASLGANIVTMAGGGNVLGLIKALLGLS
jgi:hypothetical protein